jgi:quercetin dioxygenase-like cupin family protein
MLLRRRPPPVSWPPTTGSSSAPARRRIFLGGRKVEDFVLTPRAERRLQVLHTRLEPGGTGGDESYTLPIDVEFAYVLDGALDLRIDRELYRLAKGDAITFAGRDPHTGQ